MILKIYDFMKCRIVGFFEGENFHELTICEKFSLQIFTIGIYHHSARYLKYTDNDTNLSERLSKCNNTL